MKNVDVIKSFVVGDNWVNKTKNLKIDGDKLVNYDTVIAQRVDDNNIILNMTKYSQSTTTIQNQVLDALRNYGEYFEIVKDVRMGAKSLL